MPIVLDASAALAWLIDRTDPAEIQLSLRILESVESQSARVPSLWFSEVSNGVLAAERHHGSSATKSIAFLGLLKTLPIDEDKVELWSTQPAVLALSRAYGLSAYDATYMELALRTGSALATFDQKLAQASRSGGISVFGDRP
jgi:predicted nucleic acid-binding protein